MTDSTLLKYFKVNHRLSNNLHLDMLVFGVLDTNSLMLSDHTVRDYLCAGSRNYSS